MSVEESCPLNPCPMRASARHIEAGGIGYNKGYTTLEAFIASNLNWRVIPFLDLRGHIFNDGKFAANGGIGARTIYECRTYGANLYYDFRSTSHLTCNQIGLGFETLGNLWDIRCNGYFPISTKTSAPYDPDFAGFQGHFALVRRKYKYAMTGVDAEAGFHFGKTSNFDFYATVGPYYFKGSLGKAAVGAKARVACYYKKYITLEVLDSWDTVFNNNVQGQISFSLPFGPRSPSKPTRRNCPDTCVLANTLAARMVQPVMRQEIIVFDTHHKTQSADNFFVFVDNQSHSLGTYESPYATLAAAQANSNPGDIIYVFPGDGTATGMNQGIVLKDNQQLLGSSTAQMINTNLGNITIPPQTTMIPIIGRISGTVITVANNNLISGFNINSITGGNGILNSGSITNLTVINNAIITASDSSINLSNVSGTLNISNNTMTTANFFSPVINIANTGVHNATYSIANNTLDTGTTLLSLAYTDSSSINTNITDNLLINDLRVATITIDNASSSSEHVFKFSSNTLYSQDDTSIGVTLSNFANTSIYCDNNQIENLINESVTQAGIGIVLNNNSLCNLNLNNNTIQASLCGVRITENDQSTLNMVAKQNFLGGGDNPGVAITANGGSTANISLNDNTIRSIDDDAFHFASNSSGAAIVNIANNTITTMPFSSTINCTSTSSGSVHATISNNDCSFGLFTVLNSGSGSVRSIVDANQFTNSTISITNSSTGTLCQQFNYNTSNVVQYVNGTNPYAISNGGGGTLNLEPTVGNIGFFTLTNVTHVAPNFCEN